MLRSPGSSANSDKRNVSFNEQDEVIFFDKLKKEQNKRLKGVKVQKVKPDDEDHRRYHLDEV